MGAFSGYRVIDLTHLIAGPYATKLLADYGADVIKVEPPGGEPGRWLWPFKDDIPGPERSGTFAYLNTNKRSVVLDLKRDVERERLLRLVEMADLVVESFSPGTIDRLGIGLDALRARNPRASLVSISNFGQTGPYRDWQATDLIVAATGGELFSQGQLRREPIKQAGSTTLIESGAVVAVAMAGLLFGARRGLPPQHVDFSLFEGQLGGCDRRHGTTLAYQFSGRLQRRLEGSKGPGFNGGALPCKDGFVEFSYRWTDIHALRTLLGSPQEIDGPEFEKVTATASDSLGEAFTAVLLPWLMAHTKQEIWVAAQAQGMLVAPHNTIAEYFQDPLLNERGFFASAHSEELGDYRLPGPQFRMTSGGWGLRATAPRLGQHSDEVLSEVVR